jgi:hypothetical protein
MKRVDARVVWRPRNLGSAGRADPQRAIDPFWNAITEMHRTLNEFGLSLAVPNCQMR